MNKELYFTEYINKSGRMDRNFLIRIHPKWVTGRPKKGKKEKENQGLFTILHSQVY